MRSVAVVALLPAASLLALPAGAALQGRDLDRSRPGYEAYYDTAQHLTWLADADYAYTSGRSQDGRLTFAQALSWAGQLELYGVSGWRLPVVRPDDVRGCIAGHYSIYCGPSQAGQPSELWDLMNHSLALRSIFLNDSRPTINEYLAAASKTERVAVPGLDAGVSFDNVMLYYWVVGLARIECPTGGDCTPGGESIPTAVSAGGYWSADGRNYFRCLVAAQCVGAAVPGSGVRRYVEPSVGSVSGGVETVWPWQMDMLTDYQRFEGTPSATANVWLVRTGDIAPVPEPATWVSMLAGLGLLGALGLHTRAGRLPQSSHAGR